jgi:hypothetical protein
MARYRGCSQKEMIYRGRTLLKETIKIVKSNYGKREV